MVIRTGAFESAIEGKMGIVEDLSKFFAKGNTTPQLLQKLADSIVYTRMRGPNKVTEDQTQAILKVILDRALQEDPETLAAIAALPLAALNDPIAAA